MKTPRWVCALPWLLGLFSLYFGVFGASASRAQSGQKPTLRGAQVPFKLPGGGFARPSLHPFRYLDSIRVRFHDEDNAPNRPVRAANKIQASAVKGKPAELVTQIVSDAELMRRGVPALRRTKTLNRIGVQVYRLDDPARRDEALAKLRQMPEVRYAEPVQRIIPLSLPDPNDTYYNQTATGFFDHTWPYQWDLGFIQAKEAWVVWPNKYYTAANKPRNAPKVAIIDTGIDFTHPDFANAGNASTDAAQGGQLDMTNAYDFPDDIPLSQVPVQFPGSGGDDFGHGTHVAGTAAAATNNGKGVASIGYPAQILPLRVYGATGDGDDVDAIDAIIYAADNGAVVANLSLAFDGGYSQALQDAIDYCWSKNVLVVAAMGNDGIDYVRRYPANCNKVLAVSATQYANYDPNNDANSTSSPTETLASYSTYGYGVGICAPGGDTTTFNPDPNSELPIPLPDPVFIWSTTPTYESTLSLSGQTTTTYGYLQGTSMASPHVAGLAILYAAAKNITQNTPNGAQKIARAIQRGADNLVGREDGGWSFQYGYGRINAYATLTDTIGIDRPSNTPGGVTGQVTYYGTAVLNGAISIKGAGRKRYIGNSKDDGTYRVPNVPPGTYNVTCQWQGKTLTQSVTVVAGADTMATDFAMESQQSVSVTINPHSATVNWGGNYTFSASVSGSSNQNVTWSLVSGPGSIDAAGKYTAPASGANATTATVKAVSAADSTKSDTATVYLPPTPKTLTFSPSPVNGGSLSTGTVTLTDPAPSGGAVVTLSSANTGVVTVPANVTVAAGATTATFTANTSSVSSNTSVNVMASYGGISKTTALTVNASVSSTARINSGGPAYSASGGRAFVADTLFTGGSSLTRSATITGTSDPTLYLTMRYGATFGYSVPVPNGTYTVKLHFAETSTAYFGVGKRKFNVTMNGATIYSNLDVFADAGAGNAALVKTSTVTVTNGKVDIGFATVVGTNAFVNAIEIY